MKAGEGEFPLSQRERKLEVGATIHGGGLQQSLLYIERPMIPRAEAVFVFPEHGPFLLEG